MTKYEAETLCFEWEKIIGQIPESERKDKFIELVQELGLFEREFYELIVFADAAIKEAEEDVI